jgi:hypothetical protein
VAISGKTVVVGDPRTNSVAGAAYIYVKRASGWPTTPTASLADPAATADDSFGYSVTVSGETAVVGADDTLGYGAAYIYVKGASAWPTTPTASLADPAATDGDSFGISVAISGTTAVVGADGVNGGVAYIYVLGGSAWPTTPTTTLGDPATTEGDTFGASVALSGNTAVVGAFGTTSQSGAAYIYVKGASDWPTAPSVSLPDPRETSDLLFGGSVAVSGKTAAVGASMTNSSAGAAYIYKA